MVDWGVGGGGGGFELGVVDFSHVLVLVMENIEVFALFFGLSIKIGVSMLWAFYGAASCLSLLLALSFLLSTFFTLALFSFIGNKITPFLLLFLSKKNLFFKKIVKNTFFNEISWQGMNTMHRQSIAIFDKHFQVF